MRICESYKRVEYEPKYLDELAHELMKFHKKVCTKYFAESNFLKTYELKNFNKIPKNTLKLECHIEYQLFKSLLIGRFPWNTSLSGSTIMYKRNPNKFNVDMLFSLNFLKI